MADEIDQINKSVFKLMSRIFLAFDLDVEHTSTGWGKISLVHKILLDYPCLYDYLKDSNHRRDKKKKQGKDAETQTQ